MAKDDIKKAKAENAERIANIAYSGGGHIGQDDLETAFENGADWRINNVWHKPNEEPVSFCSLLLIENSNGEFDLEYKFDPATTKRWAYVKDLIPNMEE